MDNVDLNILRQVVQWQAEGHRVVLGTITRTWGSAPRPVGSVMAIRGDGQVAGSVSGGCIEDDLIAKVRAGALELAAPQVVVYGVGAEEATRFGLPCGGTLELVLEPLSQQSLIPALLEKLTHGALVKRTLDLKTGAVQLDPPDGGDVVRLSDTLLITTHGPRWRLLIIGAGQMTHYLAQMAQALDYEVIVNDPRDEYSSGWSVPGARLVRSMPDDTVAELKPDGHTAIVALTHDPKLDDLALMEALKSNAFYVGAIGSRVNQAKRRARLKEHFDMTDAQLDRLHGPIGLKNGARTPPEIAVSILAEMIAVRYGYSIPEPVGPGDAVESGCAV